MTRHETIPDLAGDGEHWMTQGEFIVRWEAVGSEVSRRWELWDGVIIEMAAEGPLHMRIVQRAMRKFEWLLTKAGPDSRLDVSLHATLPPFKRYVPSPDLMVMPLLNGENLPQAEDGALAFKVSVMTIDYNLGPKREKYGETGLAELGVLEGETRTLRVFRRDAAGGLQPLAPLGADESIAPLFAPGHRVAVVGLL